VENDRQSKALAVRGSNSIAVYTIVVYTVMMKRNITLSAEAEAIEQAREVARSEHRTLNEAFREWLDVYAARQTTVAQVQELYRRLRHVDAGRKFTREEMNER
jgi:hypothetical protein